MVKGGFFLRKKPLDGRAIGYIYSDSAVAGSFQAGAGLCQAAAADGSSEPGFSTLLIPEGAVLIARSVEDAKDLD